jgi:hypothetical protein
VLEKVTNLSRSVRADFWTEWGDYLNTNAIPRISIPRVSSITRTLHWMARSVSKAMKKAKECLTTEGFQAFLELLELRGEKAIKEKEWDEIEKFRTEHDEEAFLLSIC